MEQSSVYWEAGRGQVGARLDYGPDHEGGGGGVGAVDVVAGVVFGQQGKGGEADDGNAKAAMRVLDSSRDVGGFLESWVEEGLWR